MGKLRAISLSQSSNYRMAWFNSHFLWRNSLKFLFRTLRERALSIIFHTAATVTAALTSGASEATVPLAGQADDGLSIEVPLMSLPPATRV